MPHQAALGTAAAMLNGMQRQERQMLRKTAAPLIIVFAVLALGATYATAQDTAAIIGSWESSDEEQGELYRAEFGADGAIVIEIIDVHHGHFAYRPDDNLLALYEQDRELPEVGEEGWVTVKIQGDRLTFFSEPEYSVILELVERPEKPKSALIGRWQVNAEESARELIEDEETRMFLTFNNDGSAVYEKLIEVLDGKYELEPAAGGIKLMINDETELGTYQLAGNQLTISFDNETHVFERVE
jgi:hypothetical protein